MSKKSRQKEAGEATQSAAVMYEEEYRIIKKDLFRVLVLNSIYLAGMLALYYTNKETHYLERWFNSIFHV